MFAVFLDRDGTINHDRDGYLHRPGDVELIAGVGEAIARLNRMGALVQVVTNQSGIARGMFTEDDMHAVHSRLDELLSAHGARIDGYFFAPWHPDGNTRPWNIDHRDRKPGLGMFEQARAKHDFDAKQSWMIGDKLSDVLFGRRAGLRTILVRTGEGERTLLKQRDTWELPPDFVVPDLAAAVDLIEHVRGGV